MSLRVLHGVPKLLTITIGQDRGSGRTGSRRKSEDHREIGKVYSDIFRQIHSCHTWRGRPERGPAGAGTPVGVAGGFSGCADRAL